MENISAYMLFKYSYVYHSNAGIQCYKKDEMNTPLSLLVSAILHKRFSFQVHKKLLLFKASILSVRGGQQQVIPSL